MPRWVLGPAGAAQLERAMAVAALMRAGIVIFMGLSGWTTVDLRGDHFKRYYL